MTIQELTERFIKSPYMLEMGAGKLSKTFNCSKEDVYVAKASAREMIGTAATKITPDVKPIYTGSERTEDVETKRFLSSKPLSPKEIEDLAGVDNINTYVARVWDKLQTDGNWTYSIDIRYRLKGFYNKDELKDKLKELMPDINPSSLPATKWEVRDQALIILIADDHVGAVNTTNLFDSPAISYRDRLDIVAEEVQRLGQSFDEVHIISLGDQLNGWNSQTTRGGHEVKSLSNKDQFDIYVKSRIDFYNAMFTSGISQNYYVYDMENSNHSGLGFSYMANQYLDMYLEAKFPWVTRTSIFDMIDGFQYGKHLILMGHGKDEKHQKLPFPAVLNAKTDLYLYEFMVNKGYGKEVNTTYYKGDLHQFGTQMGKFGRYVNVPSIAGNSDYGDINFGNTRAGALLEIIDKESYRVTSQPIWF